MILTETYFRKISGMMLPKERQALEETLAEAQSVLKEAHSKGVELECILEVREETSSINHSFPQTILIESRCNVFPDMSLKCKRLGHYLTMFLINVSGLRSICIFSLPFSLHKTSTFATKAILTRNCP